MSELSDLRLRILLLTGGPSPVVDIEEALRLYDAHKQAPTAESAAALIELVPVLARRLATEREQHVQHDQIIHRELRRELSEAWDQIQKLTSGD